MRRYKSVPPGAPIAFQFKFDDGSMLSDNETVRVVVYVNRLLTRLYGDEEGRDMQVKITRADNGIYFDITGEVASLLPEGYLQIDLSIWDKKENVIKRRYEKTVLEIGTYYNGSSWDIESGNNLMPNSSVPVLFFDYDGRVVASYTLAEAQALTELPPLPVYDRLVAQEWTHTLEEVRSAQGLLDVGVTAATKSGRTEIDIDLTAQTVSEEFAVRVMGDYTIDWGDGSTPESGTAATATVINHTYPQRARYTVQLEGIVIGESTAVGAFGSAANAAKVRALFTGNYQIGNYALAQTANLERLALSKKALDPSEVITGLLYASGHMFTVLPRGMTSISSFFAYQSMFKGIVLPPTITTISANAMNGASGFSRIVLPQSLTSVGSNAFAGVRSCTEVGLNPPVPPTSGSIPFTQMSLYCKMYVEDSNVTAYQSASNWAARSNYIYPISQRP